MFQLNWAGSVGSPASPTDPGDKSGLQIVWKRGCRGLLELPLQRANIRFFIWRLGGDTSRPIIYLSEKVALVDFSLLGIFGPPFRYLRTSV